MNKISKKEEGFTLIELLVVILIIGILLAVALPQFIGQQERASNVGGQVDLGTAYKAALNVRTDNGGVFPASSAFRAAIVASEPSLSPTSRLANSATADLTAITATSQTAGGAMGWALPSNSNVVFFARSQGGNTYCVSTKTGGSVTTVTGSQTVASRCDA